MHWLVVSSKETSHFPEWKRSVGISKDGIIFAPAAIGGDEKIVSIATLRDQVPVCICSDHVYVPIVWLAENYPLSLNQCWIMGRAALKLCGRLQLVSGRSHTVTMKRFLRKIVSI